jgi:di/tricarboxylate transporter
MSTDQIVLFTLLFGVFVFLIWGRWRYDLVAFSALLVGVITGVVPIKDAFSGFGHPATVVIALVLIISRGLANSGVIELMARHLLGASRKLGTHIGIMSGFAAALSAIMNNVAALALLMPLDIQAAAKAKRSPALTLMPLSYASILGGMITLIGTPPNIVIAEFRGEALGEPYHMFDFTPVGLVCAVAGVLFVATVGWRLIPSARRKHDATQELFELEDYVAEVEVKEGSSAIGKKVRDLDEVAEDNDTAIVGLVRQGRRLPGTARRVEVRRGDLLVLQGAPESIEALVGVLGLKYVGQTGKGGLFADGDMRLLEVAVPDGARVVGRSAMSLKLLQRYGVTLLGVARQGRRFTDRVRKLEIKAGDVLLLLGPNERLGGIVGRLGVLPLKDRGLQVVQRQKAWLTVGIFGTAVMLASTGVLYLPIALGCAAALTVLSNIISVTQLYESVEWSVIVLLGSMIPLGAALEASGGTSLIAGGIVNLSTGLSPVLIMALVMIVTMTLSDVMNNVATAVISAPVALEIANRLVVSPDPFLMAVAVAASCAFLTPIGHKNNMLIMGPGGYRFGDYWRMGLPLEILIILVGVPMILWIWPL